MFSASAEARVYDIYRADYVKGAFCSVIGGACASDSDFDSAFYQNPAALTATEANWDYDWDFAENNSVEPQMDKQNQVQENVYSGAFAWAGDKWGLGLSVAYQSDHVESHASVTDDNGNSQGVDLTTDASTYFINIPAGYRVSREWSVGAGVSFIFHDEKFETSGTSGEASVKGLKPSPGVGIFFGALYMPSPSIRFGTWFKSAMSYFEQINIHLSSVGNTIDYTEQAQLHVPWIWSTGMSWMPWEDQKTLLFDLAAVGWTYQGYLLNYDNFAGAIKAEKLISKGHKVTVEPRLGWRSPWWTGSKGTYMVGSYLEPSRTEGYNDRLHGTLGVSYSLATYFELMVGVDVSRDFAQIFITYR